MKKAKHQPTFRKVGIEWVVTDNLVNELEEFTCLMYGFPCTKSVNEVRSTMLKKIVGKKSEEIKKIV